MEPNQIADAMGRAASGHLHGNLVDGGARAAAAAAEAAAQAAAAAAAAAAARPGPGTQRLAPLVLKGGAQLLKTIFRV